MGGIASQEQPAKLHRLDYEATHGGDAALADRPFLQLPAVVRRQAGVQFLPDPLFGPSVELLLRPALDIEAAELRRAHAVQRETALMISVDQLMSRGGNFRENAEPGERIGFFKDTQRRLGKRRPAHAMKAIAAGNEVAVDFARFPLPLESDARLLRIDRAQVHIFD